MQSRGLLSSLATAGGAAISLMDEEGVVYLRPAPPSILWVGGRERGVEQGPCRVADEERTDRFASVGSDQSFPPLLLRLNAKSVTSAGD